MIGDLIKEDEQGAAAMFDDEGNLPTSVISRSMREAVTPQLMNMGAYA